MIFESFSASETKQIAYKLGAQAKPGEIYALTGDLGTGKTVFSKGFASGLEIESIVTSPTFTIINEYHDGRLPLYHFDVYRICDSSEPDDIGFDEYFFGEGVCLVEWADMIPSLIPQDTVWVSIKKDFSRHDDYRRIEITKGESYENTCG